MREVQGASKAGEDIRQPGSDIQAGHMVLAAGALLGAAEIGILATVGAAQVKVGPSHTAFSRHVHRTAVSVTSNSSGC